MKQRIKQRVTPGKPVQPPLQLAIRPEVAEARFANVIAITNQGDAVYLDFMSQRGPEVIVVSRVVVTPRVAHQLRTLIGKRVPSSGGPAPL